MGRADPAELAPKGADRFFARLQIALGSIFFPRRHFADVEGTVSFEEDVGHDELVATIDKNGVGVKGQIVVAGDADHTLTPTELSKLIVKRTGVMTADRQLVYAAPSSARASYKRILRVATTGSGDQIATTGVGTTVRVPTGSTLTIAITPDGVSVVNTAAPAERPRTIDPNWLFEVDFRLLSYGGHDAQSFFDETAAQLTNKGLIFARASTANVQYRAKGTGAKLPIISGIAADAARIGSPDGVKKGLVTEPRRYNRLKDGARDFSDGAGASAQIPGGYNPANPGTVFGPPNGTNVAFHPQPVAVTPNFASGPDGSALADRAVVSGASLGQYAPYFQFTGGDIDEAIYSVWIKRATTGPNHIVFTPYEPWQIYDFPPLSSLHIVDNVTPTNAGEWTPLSLVRPSGGGYFHCSPAVGSDYTGAIGDSGIGASSHDVQLDFAMLEYGRVRGQPISAADGIQTGDRVSYAHGSEIGTGGRLRAYFSFCPFHASTDTVFAPPGDGSRGAACTSFTLMSWDGGAHRVLIEIVQTASSTSVSAASYAIVLNSVEDAVGVATIETLSFSALDFLEVLVEAGAGAATKVKYRKNGGAWVVFTDLAALATVVPTATVNLFWDGLGDTRTLFALDAEIATYGAAGGPP